MDDETDDGGKAGCLKAGDLSFKTVMSSAFELSRKGRRQLTFNNVYQIVDTALRGIGLAYVPKDLVEGQVCAEQLCWVLEDWYPTFVGHHVYYPSRRKSSRAVELVVEALKTGYQRKA